MIFLFLICMTIRLLFEFVGFFAVFGVLFKLNIILFRFFGSGVVVVVVVVGGVVL